MDGETFLWSLFFVILISAVVLGCVIGLKTLRQKQDKKQKKNQMKNQMKKKK
jgi:uncharacterized membrane-anchored protein YhcB (DUF1043 family)